MKKGSLQDVLERVRPVSSPWQRRSAGFEGSALPTPIAELLPPEYRALIDSLGAGEGFIATRFLRLYPLDELAAANRAYDVLTYLPQHLLFGSDGGGQAFLFELSDGPVRVVEVPFIPLDPAYATATYEDFVAFMEAIATIPDDFTESLPIRPDPATAGLEIHEKHPIVLGGDPTSRDNRVLLTPVVHAQACCFFNRLVREVRVQR
jgi:hypothetical protein